MQEVELIWLKEEKISNKPSCWFPDNIGFNVTKCREKKRREEEENMARRERLREENEEIRQRTAVHQQVDTSST